MVRFLSLWLLLLGTPVLAQESASFREDARSIERLVNENYAYLDRLPNQQFLLSAKLRGEADKVHNKHSLLRFAERVLMSLADHHAITAASLPDSYAVVPSFSDLWVERHGPEYVIAGVRDGSPAAGAGIRKGDLLLAVGGVPIEQAVRSFWSDLGLSSTQERGAFAARILAAGRRNLQRELTVKTHKYKARRLTLQNLYTSPDARTAISVGVEGDSLLIKLNDSLGDSETVSAFDAAMATARPGQSIILDLTDTPSGGNTTVARALMGWFVTRPMPYQVHNLPAEERRTGIPRQWVEQVLPRSGKQHSGAVMVRVGRWTGSMGEGLAIGLRSLGAEVQGDRMAGLLGAIYDYKLPASGLVLKLPTERLLTVDGLPRENFIPAEVGRPQNLPSRPADGQ